MTLIPHSSCTHQSKPLTPINVHSEHYRWWQDNSPDSKVHGAIMGPTWVLLAPDGTHVGPMNLAIRECLFFSSKSEWCSTSLSLCVYETLWNTKLWPCNKNCSSFMELIFAFVPVIIYLHLSCLGNDFWKFLKWIYKKCYQGTTIELLSVRLMCQ